MPSNRHNPNSGMNMAKAQPASPKSAAAAHIALASPPGSIVRLSVSEQEGLVLQGLVDASPVTLLTDSRAELEVKAVKAVLNGTTSMTAQRVGERQNPDATNQHAVTSRWKREGKIFSIERAGQTLYPKYAFDELGNPIPEVAQILEIFKGLPPVSNRVLVRVDE